MYLSTPNFAVGASSDKLWSCLPCAAGYARLKSQAPRTYVCSLPMSGPQSLHRTAPATAQGPCGNGDEMGWMMLLPALERARANPLFIIRYTVHRKTTLVGRSKQARKCERQSAMVSLSLLTAMIQFHYDSYYTITSLNLSGSSSFPAPAPPARRDGSAALNHNQQQN